MKKGLINLDDQEYSHVWEIAKAFSTSDLIPKEDRGKPANILIKWQHGHEIGLSPMSSLQSIAVINGVPSLWGDAMLALIMSRSDFEDIKESFSNGVATCEIKRKGRSSVKCSFSIEDAKKARLIGKPGPWTNYEKRMLQMRARGFCIRDAYADALKGVVMAEEAMDYTKNIDPPESSKSDFISSQLVENSSGEITSTPYKEAEKAEDGEFSMDEYKANIDNASSVNDLINYFGNAYRVLKINGDKDRMEEVKKLYDEKKNILIGSKSSEVLE